MGKWSVVFALIGILTYKRRYDFLDISNRIGIRMRTTLFKKMLESDFYKKNTLFQTYLHHLVADVQTISAFTGETVFHGMRGLLFVLGGSACLLYNSPLICVIAALTMGTFNGEFAFTQYSTNPGISSWGNSKRRKTRSWSTSASTSPKDSIISGLWKSLTQRQWSRSGWFKLFQTTTNM